ncbi:extracellular solute-binding protein [Pseudomonas sp. MAFF 730085]|uniref:sn-glycerol-3-phosphate-binding periplasmic protein UgpB n=1 Tax=Pseudomonas kitaguniensis TaxID=2607908 RepID=A0A5N7JT04_9PSED|nr:extracellular solute-binding protein [Pseudomonas kitaguniensis]MPQ84532.1 extracellular solute-binding protein [Pseudomonas kitaguniensis]
MRFRTVLAAAILMAASAGSACAADAGVEFWYGHTGAASAAIQTLCERFNSTHAELLPMRCIAQGSYEQNLQKTVAAYRSGKAPALVEIYDVATPEMLNSAAVLSLEEFLQAWHKVPQDRLLPAVAAYYNNADGTLWAQPFATSTAVLYSHADQLAAAGITQAPDTWEAFGAALVALKAHGSKCPSVTDFGPWVWLEQSSAVMGAPLLSKDATQWVFDQGPHLRLMQSVAQWMADGLLIDQAATRSGGQELAFASGDCALLVGSTGASKLIYSADSGDVNANFLPVFAGQQRAASLPGGAALWVLRGQSEAQYQTVAEFLMFLREVSVQTLFSQATGYLPVTQGAAAAALAQLPARNATVVGLNTLALGHEAKAFEVRPGFTTLLRLAWQQQVWSALARQKPMADALHEAAQKGDALLRLFENTYGPSATNKGVKP